MVDSLIPEQTRALVGQALNDPVSGVIVETEAQRYAYAVDDLNPIYFDEAAANAAGYRTLVAPPTYVAHVVAQHRPVEALRVDGIYRGGAARHRIELRVKRVMFGGEEWEFLVPAYVGDTITAVTRLHSLEEKSGGSGPFVLQTVETTYTNQDGDVVAKGRTKSIAR